LTARRPGVRTVATLVALVGAAFFAILGSAQSQTATPAVSARSTSAAQATSKIAFIREPLNSGYGGVLWIMNPGGSGHRKLAPAHPGMRWSPDGQKIFFVGSGRIADSHIYVMNADGSGLQRLLTSPAPGRCDGRARWNSGPAWSPDGRAIAFTRSSCGPSYSEIYVMNADGSGQRRLTPRGSDLRVGLDDQDRRPSWSPDGRRIAFVSERDGQAEIYVMNPDGSGQRNLTRTRGWQERWHAWSPAQK
jgi:dipeptidyl aminopeptidase/acylaminoacyl peptidase